MSPVDQTILHDPDNGQYGDCMRACIASLLEVPIDQVPHFFEGGCESAVFDQRVADYLGRHGLIELSMPAEVARRTHYTRECYHLMYGYSARGTFHAVVALNGMVVHDPHPSKVGIIDDERVQFAFLVRTGPAANDNNTATPSSANQGENNRG
jgi:hypothetical protein